MKRGYATDPFIDLLFNALLGFTVLYILAVIAVQPEQPKEGANLKAEFIISINWDENSPDDVDVWVRDPQGEVVSYLNKEAGWLHLDRDDRGDLNDTVVIDGEEVVYPINQEIVTLRGLIPGEYVVNLYYYETKSKQPVDATVKIERINPSVQTVFVEQVTLQQQDDELTAIRFHMTSDGEVSQFSRLPERLTPYNLDP